MADEISDAQQRYGQFYAIQDADSRTELELERILLNTSGRVYMEPDVERVKLAVIGALETTKNFLLKYSDALPHNGEILDTIDDGINAIRLTDLDREGINVIYQEIRELVLPILGKNLGFRKKKITNYKWMEKVQIRTQIPTSPALDTIISKKKAT